MFIIFDVPLNILKSANIESYYSYIYFLADNLNSLADRKHILSLLQDKDQNLEYLNQKLSLVFFMPDNSLKCVTT